MSMIGKIGKGRAAGALAALPLLLLSGCIPAAVGYGDGAMTMVQAEAAPVPRAVAPAARPAAPPPRREPPPAFVTAQRILDARIQELGRGFDGRVGIAVRDIETGWTTSFNGDTYFPQQSVSKFWVALTAFERVDQGRLDLSQNVTVRREDLTLFHQPIRQLVGANGYHTTIDNLLFRAVTQSDNTANDFVLWQAGGPDGVRETLARKNISGVRFGPGERLLQSGIAGVEWRPALSMGNAFYTARGNVPASVRRSNFDNYVADPVDGATPDAVVEALARLHRGELLSEQSTRRLLSIMEQTRTGPQRLPAGLPSGWRIGHKTGTGQIFGGAQAGYNDIGIVTAPDGRAYAVAVLIGRTSAPVPARMQLMQQTSRAVVAYHEQLRAGGPIEMQ